LIPSIKEPYLSIVVTARNDDHGGNLLRRLQTFLNALVGQARRHSVCMELVLVEWNPPLDAPQLAQVLQWPENTAPCSIRIITVPPHVHRSHRLADVLPLFQMIAKNVGIRRAKGEYILATNIDILFSDELMQFIGERRLEAGRMYRIDRHDVSSDVPIAASVEEQLGYCRQHLLRINVREGTFPLTSDGRRSSLLVDIVAPDAGIYLGRGWWPPQQYFGQITRRASDGAEIGFDGSDAPRTLLLELAGSSPIKVLEPSGASFGEVAISRRVILRIHIPPRVENIRFSSIAASPGDIIFTSFRCQWDRRFRDQRPLVRAEPAPSRRVASAWRTARSAAGFASELCRGKTDGRIGLPFASRIMSRFRMEPSGVSFALGHQPAEPAVSRLSPDPLHTNACGDFTLAHRKHWMELRGYPEFDLYSMNLDSVFCYMAHYGGAPECVLTEPMRIYHIEHAAGSGWTPAGQELLYRRLAEKAIPWLPFEVVLQWASEMKSLHTTLIFNGRDWGHGGIDFPETSPSGPSSPVFC